MQKTKEVYFIAMSFAFFFIFVFIRFIYYAVTCKSIILRLSSLGLTDVIESRETISDKGHNELFTKVFFTVSAAGILCIFPHIYLGLLTRVVFCVGCGWCLLDF